MQVAVQSHKKWTFFRLLCTCNKFSYDGLNWDPSPERGVFPRWDVRRTLEKLVNHEPKANDFQAFLVFAHVRRGLLRQ